jgi:hypothetical protein
MRSALAVSIAAFAIFAPATSGAQEDRHALSLFIGGATSTEDDGSSGFTLGGEYEFRFYSRLGVGALVELATGDVRDVVVLAPITLHPFGGLAVKAAPGAEITDGDTEFAFRLGIRYDIPAGPLSVAPEFNADLVRGDWTYVYGLSFGVAF